MRLSYRLDAAPRVTITAPKLMRRPEEPDSPIPHTYDFNTPGRERPCLYYPRGAEWSPDKPLATTVMPWLLTWLVDYEVWYATGVWLGGGIAHGSVKRPQAEASGREVAT